MRVFYAVNFDDGTTAELKKLQDELKTHVRRGRWASLDNLHLTLHFVGDAEEEELPLLKEVLEAAAASIAPLRLRFTSFGSFRQGSEDLIYIKVKNTADMLETAAAVIKDRLGRGDMKQFTPHITLVRRAEMNYRTLKVLKKKRFNLPPVGISSIELMESRKEAGRLIYTPLYSVELRAPETK